MYNNNSNNTVNTSNNRLAEMITQLNDHDVLLGRTKECFNWAGNKHFRSYISQAVGRYLEAPTRADKSVVVNSLMLGIQELGGRFLKRCGPQGWMEVEDKHARDKCSHAVRDAANTMAKRGCLEGEQAAKAAQVSTRLARVLSDSATKKRQRAKSAIAKSKAAANNSSSSKNNTTRSLPTVTPEVAVSTPTITPSTSNDWTNTKPIPRSVSIVSDSDGSSGTETPYSSDDESVTSMSASSSSRRHLEPLEVKSTNATTITDSSLEPLHFSMVTPPATPTHNPMSFQQQQQQDDCMLTQALMAVVDNTDNVPQLHIPDASDDKCWFEPSGFQLLDELPLDDDLIMDDFLKDIEV